MKFLKGNTIRYKGQYFTINNINKCPKETLKYFETLGLIDCEAKKEEKEIKKESKKESK